MDSSCQFCELPENEREYEVVSEVLLSFSNEGILHGRRIEVLGRLYLECRKTRGVTSICRSWWLAYVRAISCAGKRVTVLLL